MLKTNYNNIIYILFLALILLILPGCKQDKIHANDVIEKNGLIYKVGSTESFTGRVVDIISNQILEYDVVKGKKNGNFKIYSENGVLLVHGNIVQNKDQGHWQYYYPTGQIESEGNFDQDVVSGNWKWYYKNGQIKAEGHFKAGKRDGLWCYYTEDGNLTDLMFYKNGINLTKKGLVTS